MRLPHSDHGGGLSRRSGTTNGTPSVHAGASVHQGKARGGRRNGAASADRHVGRPASGREFRAALRPVLRTRRLTAGSPVLGAGADHLQCAAT